jgi:hypothetical protein
MTELMQARHRALLDLIHLRRPVGEATTALAIFDWDCEQDLVVLARLDVVRILHQYRDGQVDASDCRRWAEAVEGRDDIGLEPGCQDLLKQLVFELSTPEISGPWTPGQNKWWAARLRGGWRRWLLPAVTAGVIAVIITVTVTAAVTATRGRYDADVVRSLCGRVDAAPVRRADPLIARTVVPLRSSRNQGYSGLVVGARMGYCQAIWSDASGAWMSIMQVAAAYYPSVHLAGAAYRQLEAGHTDSNDLTLPDPPFDNPDLMKHEVADAAGVGAVDAAWCAPTASEAMPAGQIEAGYEVTALDSNLVLRVYVRLVGQRMDRHRRAWAAATLTRTTLTALQHT